MAELSLAAWVILAVATVLIGITKSAIPGTVTIAVALYASALPAKESTGAILVLLIIGDIGALLMYRRTVHWVTLIALIPAVILGLLGGYWFLAVSGDAQVSIAIALILLIITAVGLYQNRSSVRNAPAPALEDSTSPWGARAQRLFYGGAGGFMTMVANAAGPALSMYFLTVRLSARYFLGTMAVFFAVLNLIKLPFSIQLGLVTRESVVMNLVLVPALLVGFAIGRYIVGRIDQRMFERLIIVFTVVGAGYLLVQGLLTI